MASTLHFSWTYPNLAEDPYYTSFKSFVDSVDAEMWTAEQTLSTHVVLTSAHGAVSAATAQKIALRDASGRVQFAEPNTASDVASKNYVDVAVAGASPAIPAGAIIQVQSTTMTNATSVATSPGNWADAGLSVTITPASIANKVYVSVFIYLGNSSNNKLFVQLLRGATPIGVGDAAGNRVQCNGSISTNVAMGPYNVGCIAFSFLDSPASVAATTYKVQLTSDYSSTTTINRTALDSDTNAFARASSTITAQEIKG